MKFARGLAWFALFVALSVLHRVLCRPRVTARLLRRVAARMYHLPEPRHRVSRRTVEIPLADGIASAATVFMPDGEVDASRPVILIRTPYDRANVVPTALIFAERGFVVVAQDARGRAGSSGDFFPIAHERDDGRATLDYVAAQPWCRAGVVMYGISYMGMVCFAAAATEHPSLRGIFPVLAGSHMHPVMFNGGAPSLELIARWSYLVFGLDTRVTSPARRAFRGFFYPEQRYRTALMQLPLGTIDTLLSARGEELPFVREGLASPRADSAFWADKNALANVSSPGFPAVHFYAGFHDFFCTETVRDFAAATAARAAVLASGQCAARSVPPVRMTIGPWQHWSILRYSPCAMRDALYFFDHLERDDALDRRPVRVYVHGRHRWFSLETWPPPAERMVLALTAERALVTVLPGCTAGDACAAGGAASASAAAAAADVPVGAATYVFDPSAPTPSIGGAGFDPANAGPMNQATVEARADVLVFTGPALTAPLLVLGHATAVLFVSSSSEYTDFIVRLCEVDRRGVSRNVAEVVARLPADEPFDAVHIERLAARERSWRLELTLGACAWELAAGHQLRVQVCSGAHPRIMRNLGTGEPLLSAVKCVLQSQTVHFGGAHASYISLPIGQLA